MRARFTVPGNPVGKGRPRFARAGNYVRTYTPDNTVTYENLIRVEYKRQCGGRFFGTGVPVMVEIVAYYSIPSSVSKKKRALMENGKILPLKKPDLDNLVKCFMDAANGVIYHDDAQVVGVTAVKRFSEQPRVEVTIEEVGEDEISG